MADWTLTHESQTTEVGAGESAWVTAFTSNTRCEAALVSLSVENVLSEDGYDVLSVYATPEELYKLASALMTVATALVRRTAARDAEEFTRTLLSLELENDPAVD